MRVHRLISIILLIQNRGKVKAKELANRLETSVRTIYRDIDILCEAGFPIYSTTGPEGGIQFIDQYKLDVDNLDLNDIINLYLSSMGIKPYINSENSLKMNNTLLKLEKTVPIPFKKEIEKIKNHYYFDETPWWEENPKMSHMDVLIRSINESFKLKIVYQKVNEDTSKRIIRPYGLVVKRLDWYLIAYCESINDMRIFKCERILQIEKVNETFVVPQDFNISDFWLKSGNGFKTMCHEQEHYPVTIQLKKTYLELLKDFEVHEIIQDNNIITATINLHSFESGCTTILKYLMFCEVIKPIELRRHIKEFLNKQIKVYSM